MILNAEEGFYDLPDFLDRLAAAARGVVRVSGRQVVFTGWLVTPTLVVVPDHVVEPADVGSSHFGCVGFWDRATAPLAVPGQLLHAPPGRDGRQPAVLRLDHPIPGAQPLRLELGAARAESRVLLVHHPGGELPARLSLGQVTHQADGFLYHNGNTMGGSSGAPILAAAQMGVLAMQVGGLPEKGNFGLPLAAVLDGLRSSPVWSEIAEQHGLADVAVASGVLAPPASAPGPSDPVIAAALSWSTNAASLTPAERELLSPLVVDATKPRWTLPLPHRQRLLRAAGSPEALRELRRAHPTTEPGHQVIDVILAGPPYDLDQVPLDVLPHWLQAVRWFEGVLPDLPSAALVHRTMQRRRVREELTVLAGPGFRGRKTELARLAAWFDGPDSGPMVISGIGGVGKSALVARFAQLLPGSVPLFWLDFDRADLAPDHVVSLVSALAEQATIQLDGITAPVVDPESWALGVSAFGAALDRAAPGPVLLVLDGFEIAQNAVRNHLLWPVLSTLLDAAPGLRLLVSGRAPVPNLPLGHRHAHSLHLAGLDPEIAAAWLAERGVTDPPQRDRVIVATRGMPLALKLAMRLLDEGGDLAELPDTLVEGYLYRRILDRVVDLDLQPLACDVLQLRAVHADMLAAVLHDRIDPDDDPAQLLERLSRELALVESLDESGGGEPGVLRMRPEVRTAVLELLAVADPARVVEIDRRAVAWLASRPADDRADAAELVYHRLRLGDVAGAAAAWREGCAARLATAVPDLSDPRARAWLSARLAGSVEERLAAWEQDAAERIYRANKRGLAGVAADTLDERAERTAASPLLVHDAWVRWQAGDRTSAAALLDTAGPATGQIARDRALVRAGLAAESGDLDLADRLLAGLAERQLWPDSVHATAVLAARVRLTVDLERELELASLPAGLWTGEIPDGGLISEIRRRAVPGDVLLPTLAQNIAGLTTYPLLRIPDRSEGLGRFETDVHELRRRLRDRWPATTPTGGPAGGVDRALELADWLGDHGERRWRLATGTPVLFELRGRLLDYRNQPDPLAVACVASLAAFRGLPMALGVTVAVMHWHVQQIDDLAAMLHTIPVQRWLQEPQRPALLRELVAGGWEPAQDADPLSDSGGNNSWRTVALFAACPDPLELLIRRILGLPEDETPQVNPMPSILDMSPYPWSRPEAQQLHIELARAFPSGKDAVQLAAMADLDPLRLYAEQPPLQIWYDILREAAPAGMTRVLAQVTHDKVGPRAPLRSFLAELLADHPVATSGEPLGSSGEPAFDDTVLEPEALLYHDDLTIEMGRVPEFITALGRLVALGPAVCRMTTSFGGGTQYGTAFRIGDDLLLTNWHVVHHKLDGRPATAALAEFRFEDDGRGGGLASTAIRCTAAPVAADRADDWAVLRTEEELRPEWPVLPLLDTPNPVPGDAAFVIQHPLGGRKRVAIVRNQVSFVDDRIVHYLTDTQGGSSGSPVLDSTGQLIALHHAGGRPQIILGKPPVSKNEGIRIPRIVAGLAAGGITLD